MFISVPVLLPSSPSYNETDDLQESPYSVGLMTKLSIRRDGARESKCFM